MRSVACLSLAMLLSIAGAQVNTLRFLPGHASVRRNQPPAIPGAHRPQNQLVVGLGKGTSSNTLVRIGKIVAHFEPGVYLIEPIIANPAAKLAAYKGVSFVMPADVMAADQSSLPSVERHLKYLKAVEKLTGVENESTDFYEHLLWFLQYRVNENGYVDPSMYAEAVRQRDLLRPARNAGFNPPLAGNWSFIGPKNLATPYQQFYGNTPPLSGRVTGIAYGTSKSIIYAATGGGGIWKTLDAGVTWNCMTDTPQWIYSAVSSIAVDPTNRNIVYAGTGDYDGFHNYYTFGIMKSTDGGGTWTNYGQAQFGDQTVSHIVVDPDTPSIVTITTGHGALDTYGGGIWRSTDGGQTWAQPSGIIASAYSSLDIGPYLFNRMYFAVGAASNGVLAYRSDDQGQTWLEIGSPENVEELHPYTVMSMTDHDIPYVLTSDNHKIYSSGPNGGASWVDITPGFPSTSTDGTQDNWKQAYYDYFLGMTYKTNTSAFSDDIMFAGLITLAKAHIVPDPTNSGAPPTVTWSDIGKTYDPVGAIIHNDQHCSVTCPFDRNEILIGCDGGLFKYTYNPSTDSGVFASLNANLGTTQFYAIAAHPTDPNQVIGGTQDNASPASSGNLASWQNLKGGDGGFCAFDATHNTRYTTGNNNLYEYVAGEVDPSNLQVPLNARAAGVAPLVLTSEGEPIMADYRLLVYDGIDWHVRGPGASQDLTFGGTSWVRTLAIAQDDPKVVYSGSADGTIWRTDDLGLTQANWHRVDGDFFHLNGQAIPIGAICPDPNNYKDVLVAIGRAGITTHLAHCVDTTVAKPVWFLVDSGGTGGLPNVPANAVVRDPYDPHNTWYVATDLGVFVTRDQGSHWANMTSSLKLPNTLVMDLKFGAGYLYAGTFGRGIWRIALSDSPGLEAIALATTAVPGGISVAGKVLISHEPAATFDVPVSSSDPAVASVPTAAAVPATALDGPFTITTTPVDADTPVTITATLNGLHASAVLTVKAPVPSLLKISPNPVVGGNDSTGTVTLTGDAPSAGTVVNLQSNDPTVAEVPDSVSVDSGTNSATFTITTSKVSATTNVIIRAIKGATTISLALPVQFAPLASLGLAPTAVVGGNPGTGTLTMTDPAPVNFGVTVTSSNPAVVPSLTAFTVVKGATTKAFGFFTNGVAALTSVVITAKGGDGTRSATLNVYPASLTPFAPSSATMFGGSAGSLKIQLNGGAPPAGAKVTLKSDSALVVVPPSATVAYDLHSLSFGFSTYGVAAATVAHITGTYLTATETAAITLNPATIHGITCTPTSVKGGTSVTATVTLNGKAPTTVGVVVTMASDNADAVMPTSATIPENGSSISFLAKTKAVTSSTIVHLRALYKGTTVSCSLTISP